MAYEKMSGEVYDAIYGQKDYKKEASTLQGLIDTYGKSGSNEMLDVACGTGSHLPFLTASFEIEGLDLSDHQLNEARKRLPDLQFHQGDMRDFQLDRQFDVVTCLFSSIGYVYPAEEMSKAVTNMAGHLKPGGVLLIEPWFAPGKYTEGTVHAVFVDEPELKISRINTSDIEDGVSVMKMHHLVGRPSGVEHFVEEHRLGLYENEEYMQALHDAGLEDHHDEHGLTGRGLFIGVKA